MQTAREQQRNTLVEQAVKSWGDTVYRVALGQTGSRDDAQDVSQDVFCRLMRADDVFESAEHLKAWLIRVTVNRSRDLTRARRRHSTDSLEEHLAEAEQKLLENANCTSADDPRIAALHKAVDALPVEQREALDLFYGQGLATEEIARQQHCSPGAVRTRLYRARATLRRLLGVGTAALALALVLVLGAGRIPFAAAPTPPDGAAGKSGVPAAIAPKAGGSFALTAWAEGLAEPALADPRALTDPIAVRWLHPQYWDPSFDAGNAAANGPTRFTGIAHTIFNFDARCEGAGLRTVTYEIAGTSAYFSAASEGIADASDAGATQRLTVSYADGEPFDGEGPEEAYLLNVVAPLGDEAAARYDEYRARAAAASAGAAAAAAAEGPDDRSLDAGSPLGDHGPGIDGPLDDFYLTRVLPAGYAETARALDGATLTLTATFDDGTVQTRTYRIGLVDDLTAQCERLARMVIEDWEDNEGRVSRHEALPALFTLTLVEGASDAA